MISTIKELCEHLPYLYLVIFIVSLGTSKQQTSLSITVILMATSEFIISSVNGPLLAALNDKSIEYVVRVSAWTSFWCLFNLTYVCILQKCHEWLNLGKGRVLITAQVSFGVLSLFELLRFLDAMFFNVVSINNVSVKDIYTASIALIGMFVGIYLLVELLLSIKDSHVHRVNRLHRTF